MFNRKKITLNFWNKIDRFIKENNLIKEKGNIIIALSGGPDSMALLHYFLKKRKDLKIIACHLNHSIRGKKADKDANFVRKYCQKENIKLIEKKIDIPYIAKKNRENIEHIARKKRYEFLINTAIKEKAKLICTAHHLDDNAETILLNLLRGTNIKGLKGIPIKRKISNSISIIRPMLAVTKKEIFDYLKANEIKYRLDHTNEDEKYTRNWIRKKLIPMIEKKQPRFKEHLLNISKSLYNLNI